MLIRVRAAGVNRSDIRRRERSYAPPLGAHRYMDQSHFEKVVLTVDSEE